MLETRSLDIESENEEVWVGIRIGDKIEATTLEFPTIEVEASDAADDDDAEDDGSEEPYIAVCFTDGKHQRRFAFTLDVDNAKTLGTMLLAMAYDREVEASLTNPAKPLLGPFGRS